MSERELHTLLLLYVLTVSKAANSRRTEVKETIMRTGAWGTCGACPRVDDVVYPERCPYGARYDHLITHTQNGNIIDRPYGYSPYEVLQYLTRVMGHMRELADCIGEMINNDYLLPIQLREIKPIMDRLKEALKSRP